MVLQGELNYSLIEKKFQLLRNTYITVCIFDVYTLIAYSLATLEQSKLYLGEEITQHLDCLYNTLICL